MAALAAAVFAAMVGTETSIDAASRTAALRYLLYSYAGLCLVAAACAWVFVPNFRSEAAQAPRPSQTGLLQRLALVLRTPNIWLQAVVIISAYSAFKMFDNYGLYAEDAYGLSPADSAKVTAYLSFLRAAAALAAGWMADRWLGISSAIQLSFGLLMATYGLFLLVDPSTQLVWFMIANMGVSCAAFFALRGIYFGLLEESGTPKELTGTAVGIISFVGFTPEIFMPPLTGWLISSARSGGDVLVGYDRIFGILVVLSALGLPGRFGAASTGDPTSPGSDLTGRAPRKPAPATGTLIWRQPP